MSHGSRFANLDARNDSLPHPPEEYRTPGPAATSCRNRAGSGCKSRVSDSRRGKAVEVLQYQGQRFDLAKSYADFRDYKDDPENLTPAQIRRAELLMRSVKFGPRFKSLDEVDAALARLEFPGYGRFYANQLGAHIDPKLELVYVEVPARGLNRYMALERQADESLLVVDDFVAAAEEPGIARVTRGAGGRLEYRQPNGKVVVPSRR